LITVYDAIDCDLAPVGGPREGAVADTLMQEVDLRTGLVMYEWHSLDHVPLESSYSSPALTSRADPFDYFHINSLECRAGRRPAGRLTQHVGGIRHRSDYRPGPLGAGG